MTESKHTCKACRIGALHPSTVVRTYTPNGSVVQVELLTSKCNHCGELTTLSAQHSQNLVALAARKAQYAGVLMGEEYLSLRKKYGLTQQMASKIFGKGIIAFSRYENEETYPDKTTGLLISLAIERSEVLRSLADKAGVAIPLWNERLEDEQRIKVILFPIFNGELPTVLRERVEYHSNVTGVTHAQTTAELHPTKWLKSVSSSYTDWSNAPSWQQAVAM